jgi:HEAT repeat protein
MDPDIVNLVQGLDNLHENLWVQTKLITLGHRAVPSLRAFLNGPPSQFPDGRVLAAEALGAIRGEEAVDGLIAALSANPVSQLSPVLRLSEEMVRNAAARELGRIGDRGAIEPLLRALREDRLQGAAEALTAFREERAIPLLIEGLEDAFKREAMGAAIRSFKEASIPYLLKGLKIRRFHEGFELLPSIERRSMILRLLGELEATSAIDAILATLIHERPAVRLEAAVAASKLVKDERVRAAIPILKEGLNHPDFLHRNRCSDALAMIKRNRESARTAAERRRAE